MIHETGKSLPTAESMDDIGAYTVHDTCMLMKTLAWPTVMCGELQQIMRNFVWKLISHFPKHCPISLEMAHRRKIHYDDITISTFIKKNIRLLTYYSGPATFCVAFHPCSNRVKIIIRMQQFTLPFLWI